MANNYQEQVSKATEVLEVLRKQVELVDKQIAALINTTNTFSGLKTPSNVSDELNKRYEATKKLTQLVEKQSKQVKAAATAEINLEKQKQKQIDDLFSKRKKQIDQESKLQQKKSKDYIRAEQEVLKEQQKAQQLRETQVKKESDLRTRLSKQKQKERVDSLREQDSIQKNKAALQSQKATYLELGRAYNVLIAKQKQAKKVLQDLIATGRRAGQTQKEHKKEVQRATLVYGKYTAKVNQANKATSNFSRKGLSGAVRGFRNLLGAFGIIGGIQLFASLVKNVFDTTKKLQSLSFALNAVADDAYEVSRTQEFLADITQRFGADIITTTERYTKFLAAAKQSNVTLKDTEDIFRTVTKAAGVLGLKTDELTGIYLALEQMLSKGKVTTEELRRQLGERLPGAFGIMAKALNVTVPQLDKMLRTGQIMSADALPKLAKALEAAYNIENVERVDTLVAAQTRLNNSWVQLVASFSGEGGGEGLTGIFNALSERIDLVAKGMNALQKALAYVSKGFKIFLDIIRPVLKAYKDLTGVDIVKFVSNFGKLIKILTSPSLSTIGTVFIGLTKAVLGFANVFVEVAKRVSNVEFSINPIKNLDQLKTVFTGLGQVFKDGFNAVDDAMDADRAKAATAERVALLKRVATKMTEVAFITKNETLKYEDAYAEILGMTTEKLREKEQALIKILGSQKAVDEGEKESIVALEGSIAYQQEQISVLEEKRDKLARNSKEYEIYAKAIRHAKSALEDMLLSFGVGEINPLDTKGIQGGVVLLKKAVDEQIKILQEALELYPEMSKEYMFITKQIENLQEAISSIDVTDANLEIEGFIDNFNTVQETAKKLKEELDGLTKDFFSGFKDDFFSEAGFDKLNEMFLTFDESGQSMFDKLWANAETTEEKFAVAFNAISEVAQEAFNFLAQNGQARFDLQYERLEKEKDIALQFAGESTAAKERIEEQYEAKKKAIQRRQAKSQKQLAIFNTIINTAQGVVSALAMFPPNPVLSGIIAGVGAAQVALIASQPVPEFFRGTMNAPEGYAMVDEKTPEVHTDRQGRVKSFGEDKANLRYLSAGDKIYKTKEMYFEKELNNVLGTNDIFPYSEMFNTMPSVVVENQGLKASDLDMIMAKHFSNIQVNQTTIDKNGLRTFVKNQGGSTEKLNNRTNFRGFSV